MSPSGDGAINGGCRCSCLSGENGGFHDGAEDYCIPRSHYETCTHCARCKPSLCSSSALGFDSILLTDSEKLRRIVVASAKGFSIGAGIKGGLALFSILARLRRKKSRYTKIWSFFFFIICCENNRLIISWFRKVEAFTDKEAVSMAIKETIRYGLFLGTFAGTFVSVDEIIGALGGHNRQCS